MPFKFSYLAGLTGLAAVLLVCLPACGLLREPLATPAPTRVVPITADQAAQAMDDDRFYATYGHTTLLIQSIVAAIDPQPEHLILTLATSGSSQVLCDLGTSTAVVKIGDHVTVRSADPEKDVARQGSNLLIHNCALP